MPIIHKLRRLFVRYLSEISGKNLLLIVVSYFLLCWLGLTLSGEQALTAGDTFLYWMLVTMSTVGYGDLSPVTVAGRWFTAVFVIPAGLGLFAFTLGQIASSAARFWRLGVKGLKNYSKLDEHIVVVGWNEAHTLHLLELLIEEEDMRDNGRPILLLSSHDHENPFPDRIKFVRASHYTDEEAFLRAGIANANCIIIDTPQDDSTLTCALYTYQANRAAHILVYFRDDSLSQLLKSHCPTVECAPSVSVEMLAKAAADPGSSHLHHDLLNVKGGMTQFSLCLPSQHTQRLTFGDLFSRFKQQYDAIAIGVAADGEAMAINPPLDFPVAAGARLYYIANKRIDKINWDSLA